MKNIHIIIGLNILFFCICNLNAKTNATKENSHNVCLWDDNHFNYLYEKKISKKLNNHQSRQLEKIKNYYNNIASEEYIETYDYLHPALKRRISKNIYEQIMSIQYMGSNFYIGKIEYIRPAGGGDVNFLNEKARLIMFYIFRKPAEGVPVGNSNLTSDLWFNNNDEIYVIPMPFLDIKYQAEYKNLYNDNKNINVSISITMDDDTIKELEKSENGKKILKRNLEYEANLNGLIKNIK